MTRAVHVEKQPVLPTAKDDGKLAKGTKKTKKKTASVPFACLIKERAKRLLRAQTSIHLDNPIHLHNPIVEDSVKESGVHAASL